MGTIVIKPSDAYDVFKLKKLRKEDEEELEALNKTPQQSLLRGFIFSDECFSVWHENEIIGMFGVSSFNLPKGFCTVWFLGNDECTKHPVSFVKEGKKYINKWLKKYDLIMNAVYEKNKTHIAWLKAVGVSFSSSVIINNHKFIQFYKVKEHLNNV